MEKIIFMVKSQKYDFFAMFCGFQQNGLFCHKNISTQNMVHPWFSNSRKAQQL